MGTVASIHIHGDVDPALADHATSAAFAELQRLEAMFTTFRKTSEISRVEAGSLSLLDCSAEVIDVLDGCTWLEHASGGAFCIRREGRLDPAGFVKGWAAERAANCLRDHGLSDWYLAVGGDLVVSGSPHGEGGPWTIAIANPLRPGGVITAVSVTSGAVATSGTAERGAHLRHADGSAANAFASVTVLGPSLTWADAFATTAFVMGDDGLDWVARFDGYRAFAVTLDGRLLNTTTSTTT